MSEPFKLFIIRDNSFRNLAVSVRENTWITQIKNRDAMNNAGDVFDDEDHGLVTESMSELASERDRRRSEHEARVRLYEESIVALEGTLRTRKELLAM